MFRETEQGETQYCPMCEEWAEKYECLQTENKRLQMLSCANCGEQYLSPDGAELYEKNVQLKAENEELKAKFNNNSLCNKIQIYEADEARMRKALEEIREYIQSLNKDICNNCGWHNTDGCSPNGYVCHDLIEIQNKISEVLDERN